MKKWKIIAPRVSYKTKLTDQEILNTVLHNRQIKTPAQVKDFLKPVLEKLTIKTSGIDTKEYTKFEKRINRALRSNEKIVVYGDYDVDGICASAILWETLYSKTKNVYPFIPDRVDEGYGLSEKGIDRILVDHPETKIIITVDNGIVAFDAVRYANSKGIDVVITDHHVKGKKNPESFCLLHTTSLCGAGIAWLLAKELGFESNEKVRDKLGLATLATIADLVPLVDHNRAIVSAGLEILKNTNRIGIVELLNESRVDQNSIDVYTVGHVIAPRLNASGRIQSAMNALRLLCTTSRTKAIELSRMLGNVNRDRQDITNESVEHARVLVLENTLSQRINIVSSQKYNPGVIGLIASHLVEIYYKPSFAISLGDKISKGSARSIHGVNIIDLIRSVDENLIDAGGHPMAAGFTVETEKLEVFLNDLVRKAEKVVTKELLERFINIDLILPLSSITKSLFSKLSSLEPFGMGNPEPVFGSYGVEIVELRRIGKEQDHLKLKVEQDGKIIDAVAFKWADKVDVLLGDKIDIAYTINENNWNDKVSLQLKIRDIRSG